MPKVSEDHLAARRRQILDGARRCFAEYGYDKATVRRLEQAIGMSRGAIFHHFRDKDALFFALAREDTERMAAVTGWLISPRSLDPIVSRITRTPESRSEELVKKAIEGDALRIGSGDTVKHEEAISPFTAKLFSNITGSQRYVLIAVRHTQPATVDESRKAAIFHHDIRQAGIAMGHDEILAVGHPRLEPGEQFGWREPLMLFVQIILIDKTGFHPSTCSLDAMFRLVVEWAGSRIKRMQPPHCISHDGYLLGRSKVR